MPRQEWSNRLSFIMAATGSAIGLGNVWRFPFVCYQNGGGAFLVPFFIAMLTVGVPLLMVEFALGKLSRSGAPMALRWIHPRLAWIGWFAALAAFVVVCYYAVIMAWSFNYLWHSLSLAWGSDASTFFSKQVLDLSEGVSPLGGIRVPVLIGLILTWISIYLILRKGVDTVSKVVMVTVPLPVVLLLVLVVRGLTLPGAMEGLTYYLTPDFSILLQPSVWIAAYGQVLFSFSLGQAVLIAYASYLPKDADVNGSAVATAALDASFSFIAGFAVFSTLGYLAVVTHASVADVVASGPGLAFVTYPTAISLLPFGQPAFGVVFFLMLLTLGIDSAFALVEGTVTAVRDWFGTPGHMTLLVTCILAFLIGIVFTTRAGYFWLDIVDHFINNFGLVTIALGECIAVGWILGSKKFRSLVNSTSTIQVGNLFDLAVKFIAPLMLATMLGIVFVQRLRSPYENYPDWAQFVGGWGMVLTVLLASVILGFTRPRMEKENSSLSIPETDKGETP
ncbi:MAG TPA: sodium-dependent transporter [Thermoanaerobaculia bacterium]|nr:sodium-dependent transporter [Thermoanaerobaculia bacterium]HUM31141.1 sodium-dependent transporter [Thermoanaerobaculia bacterium]HXK69497.1 sodium-dependent transporter [Thermoanaerobaculia bacterium]